ncbi:MAG: N-6 DNA methylase [Paludibacteraceae bacterium]|nr:N-6 DNA methylase [Paludibacteraceae bacterium]
MFFQNSVIKKYIAAQEAELIDKAWETYKAYFLNPAVQENIRASKEEQFQEGFLRELFVKVFGYTLNPMPDFNLITEQKNETDAKKADGAILRDGKVIGVIELKDHKTTDLSHVERQAFGYKSQHKDTKYVVISNFEKLRFYIDNAVEHIEWNLFTINQEQFRLLYFCLSWANIQADKPLKAKQDSVSNEDEVTQKLYKDYSAFKRDIFADILAHNTTEETPKEQILLLFKKTQKLLDRLLFIFFAEDGGLLPPNLMMRILTEWEKLKEMDEYRPLYERIKKYFVYLNEGHTAQNPSDSIFAYNGGLFKPDEVLDGLTISDELLAQFTRKLADYDYSTEVDVNILGHIFENSLNEIEEVTAQINAGEAPTVSKRKRDGVFYTPQYITKYIVENTVGKLCAEKKAEMGIDEQEYFADKNRQTATKKRLLDQLTAYREWLLGITICDPACGSGAFLNAALQFLMAEHKLIDEMETKVTGSSIAFPWTENSLLENNLYGVDINEESVEIARLALWLRTAKPHRKLSSLNNNIKCGNSLISDPEIAGEKAFNWQAEFPQVFAKGGFDIVIGNPPYGATFSQLEKQYIPKVFKSYRYKYESYIYFIEKALDLVKKDGIIEYITPQLWLSLDESYNIRNIVLQNDLQTIRFYGEDAFPDAVVNTCSYKIQKHAPQDKLVIYDISGNQREASKKDIVDSQSLKINFRLDIEQVKLLKKIKIDTISLSEFGTIIQGITPYDKARGQSEEIIKSRAYHHSEKIDDTCGYWLDGQDVSRYSVGWSGTWLSYGEWLAAPREKRFFEGSRLLFREIPGQGKRLQAAFYDEVAYYGHSISPFKLGNDDDVLLKAILACVNSKLLSWYGALVLPNLAKDIFPKVNPKDIAQLPIPSKLVNEREITIMLSDLADRMLSLNRDLQTKRARFIRRLQDNMPDIKITGTLETFDTLDFAGFVAELKKQKIKLSLVQQDEWEEYFGQYKAALNEISAQISATDKEIDERVYALYGLTEDEIKVIEG